MTAETADIAIVPITVDETPSARSLLGLVDLRTMGRCGPICAAPCNSASI
jgi:hypothetical protein